VARHWWQILGLWVLGAGALGYVIQTYVKPQYQADSLLRVEPSPGRLFDTPAGGETFEPYLETQVQLITSPNVLSAALADPKVAGLKLVRDAADPEVDVRKKLQVGVVPRSYLIRVVLASPSAAESAAVVNAVTDAYLRTAEEWADGSTRTQIKNLEDYQRQLEDQADERQRAWQELAAKGNLDMQIIDPVLAAQAQPGSNLPVPSKSKATVEEYKEVRRKLLQVDFDLAEAEAVLANREAEARGAAPGPNDNGRAERALERAFRGDPEAVELLGKINKARDQYDKAVRVVRSPSDPSVTRTYQNLKALLDKYDRLFLEKREELAAKLEASGVRGVKAPELSLAQAREDVQRLRALKARYEEHLARLDVTNKQEGSDQVKVTILREDLSNLRDMLRAVEKRLEQLRFESKGQARISKISEARANQVPVSDNRLKYMLAAPVGLLGLLLGLFVMLDLKVGRVADAEELARRLPVEVFAVPPLPGPRLEPGQRGAREREARLQEFLQTLDHLRVALCGEEGPPGTARCLLVTSATAGEGKTTLAAQLSACCAKAGVSTLVVDADLRRSTLSRILHEGDAPGLSDVLQGELDPDAALVALPDAGFHFLPAGRPGRDPSWLLTNQRVGRLLAHYRQGFDLIILDTPPLLPVPDALTLGRWSDGVVLTCRFEFSRLPLVARARARLASAGIPLLKMVVNGVRASRFSYGYGYGGYGPAYGYAGSGGHDPDDHHRGARPQAAAAPSPAPAEAPGEAP
jgi:capsular exopolysaccharide synthesis family protein